MLEMGTPFRGESGPDECSRHESGGTVEADARMKRMISRASSLLVVIALVVCAGPALAVGPGLGIGGEAKLHPYLDLDLMYNSNVNNLPSNETGDLVLAVHPGIFLLVPSQWINLDLGGKVGYSRYFGIQKEEFKRNVVEGEASLKVVINPQGAFQVEVLDNFNRTEEPRDYVEAKMAGRFSNLAKALLVAEPGGKALRLSAGYGFSFDYYDDDTGLASGDQQAHNFYFDTRWRFLPKNSLLLHFDMQLLEYPNSGANFQNTNSKPLRASIGLAGLLTRTLSFRLFVGYGDSLMDSGDSFRSAIAQLALAQSFDFGLTISGGYKRDFQPAMVFRYYNEDRVFLKLVQSLVDGDLNLELGFQYAYVSYGSPETVMDATGNPAPCQVGPRHDNRLRLRAGIGYQILDFLEARVSYGMDVNLTGFNWVAEDPSAPGTCISANKAEFTTHKTWLSIVFHY